MVKDRLLFFDLLRIICIGLIVYGHQQYTELPALNAVLYMGGYTPFNLYPLGLTGLAVMGFLFVSGAVLEYTYTGVRNFKEYFLFLGKRIQRLYPAFWISLFIRILVTPSIITVGILALLFEFTGFFVVAGQGQGNLNIMGWFIATIMCLYILFPLLSEFIRKYDTVALLTLLTASLASRYLLITYDLIPLKNFTMWFPLCTVFEFALGIYIVKHKLYPKTTTDNRGIRVLSDVCFYVFLIHLTVIGVFKIVTSNGAIFPAYPVYYTTMMTAVFIGAYIVMQLDGRVQSAIKKSLPDKKV